MSGSHRLKRLLARIGIANSNAITIASLIISIQKTKSRVAVRIAATLLLFLFAISISLIFLPNPINSSQQSAGQELSESSAIINLSDRRESYNLINYLKYLEDKDSNFTIEQVSSSEFSQQFQSSKIDPPNYGYTASTYWAKLQLQNPSDRDTKWILSIDHHQIDHISIYTADAQQKWTAKTTGLLYPFSSREIRDRLPAFPINISAQTSQDIYLRFQSTSPIIIQAYLREPTAFWQYRNTQNIWFGIVYGILIFAIFYNLFLFTALKEQIYLYYALFVFAALIAFLVYDGFGIQYLWQNAVWWNKYAVHTLLYIAFISLTEAIKLFLGTKKYMPRWHPVLLFYQGALVVLLVSLFFLPFRLAAIIAILICISLCFFAFALGVVAFSRKYLPARYYLLSFSCFLITFSVYLLSLLQVIPNYEWLKDTYRVGTVAFVVLLSLALADRINLLKADKLREQKLALAEKDILNEDLKRSQSQLLEREQQLEYDVLHDALTGLANRAWLMQRLQDLMQQRQKFAILFIDLDRFKVINDSLGHLVGDELLKHAARRMQSILPNFATLTRFGGDEFVILMEEYTDLDTLTNLADLLQMQLQLPFNLSNYELFISASLGINLATEAYTQPVEILRDADLAMYRAKHMGRGRYALFTQCDRIAAMNRLNREGELRRALDNNEFYLMYQPILSLQTQQVCGFEALVRWENSAGEQISPSEFIPITEETGLIYSLGWWILREACGQTQIWNQQLNNLNNTNLSINVNVSPIQLRQVDFVRTLKQILMETGLPNHCLKLEITESCLLENIDSDANLLKQLKDLGIQLCIDDFGTGYSSLSRLHELPIDTLKIDQSFIKRIDSESDSTAIIETIISLAQSLDIYTVAEGVETRSQLDKLMAMGCNFGQGYLFSKPCDQATAYQTLQNKLVIS